MCIRDRYRKVRLRRQEKVNTAGLKDPEKVQEYAGKVRNKLNGSVAGTVEEKWQSLKCALLETAREVLGIEERRRQEDWFDEECRESIARRNEAHRKYSQCRTRERKKNMKRIEDWQIKYVEKRKELLKTGCFSKWSRTLQMEE